jgi:hypothetical protein
MKKDNGRYIAVDADTGQGAGDRRGGRAKTALLLLLFFLFCAKTPPLSCTEIFAGPVLQCRGDTAMTILWDTDTVSAGVVTYAGSDGTEVTVSSGSPGTYHVVTLAGLAPGQRYDYSVKDGNETLHRSYFKTLPAAGPYRVVLLGDTHAPRDGFSSLVPLIANLKPNLIVFLGDMVGHGEDPSQWLTLLETGRILFDHIPVLTVVGDHEHENDTDPSLYDHFFPLSNDPIHGPDDYEVSIAGDRFIFLDVQKEKPGSIRWFRTTLRSAGKNRDGHHIFVLSHKGITSYRAKRAGCLWLRLFQPLMAECGVTALFSGHDHHYVRGRTYLGLPFFISGGGGGAPYEINRGSFLAWLVGRMEASYVGNHFLVLDVSGDRCTVRAVNDRGRTVDTVDLGAR